MALLVLTLNIYIKNIYRLAKKAAGRHTKKRPESEESFAYL